MLSLLGVTVKELCVRSDPLLSYNSWSILQGVHKLSARTCLDTALILEARLIQPEGTETRENAAQRKRKPHMDTFLDHA